MLSPEFLVALLFLGFAIVILLASILALQGRRFWGSWLMFGGMIWTILSGLGIAGIFQWMDFLWRGLRHLRTRQEYDNSLFLLELLEEVSTALLYSVGASLLLSAIGFVLITRQWIKIHLQCINLELETKRLSQLRDLPVH